MVFLGVNIEPISELLPGLCGQSFGFRVGISVGECDRRRGFGHRGLS